MREYIGEHESFSPAELKVLRQALDELVKAQQLMSADAKASAATQLIIQAQAGCPITVSDLVASVGASHERKLIRRGPRRSF